MPLLPSLLADTLFAPARVSSAPRTPPVVVVGGAAARLLAELAPLRRQLGALRCGRRLHCGESVYEYFRFDW